METEIFKDIPGYEGFYQVSDLGRVKSLQRVISHPRLGKQTIKEKFLKPELTKDGYYRVTLNINSNPTRFSIHRLVMYVFEGPSDMDTDHINGIKTDNRLMNLRRCTQRENTSWYYLTQEKASRFTGVFRENNRWGAQIVINGKHITLGKGFSTEEAAHNAYQSALKKHLQNEC